MAIKKYNPTSPARRFMSVSTFEEITKTTPERALLEPLKKNAGRNSYGRITVRHRGGGNKRQYRIIDFKRNKDGMNNAERRIPVQYSKRVVGRKTYGGQSTHIPIKVALAGVIPIIFASSITTFPSTIAALFGANVNSGFWKYVSVGSGVYAIIYFLLIIAFTFFYTQIQFNPIEMANNMKMNGGFIPGIRPGRPTSEYITKVLNKITIVGSLFLAIVAIVPMSFRQILPGMILGGTSLLIVEGVALETVRALESQMMVRHYKGFLE